MNYKTAGKTIKKARQKKGLTQVEVAEKAELHFNYYARVERGDAKPTIETLEKICKPLSLKLSDLVNS